MSRGVAPDPGTQGGEDHDVTQPMCVKHWWATLAPDGACPICAGQSGRR